MNRQCETAEALAKRLPNSAPLLMMIEDEMRKGSIYRALRAVRKLVELEQSGQEVSAEQR